ncbi:MAG: glycosyltransferase family 4 protein [Phormidesmis sp.]
MRIAYLTGEYPRVTDTFIQREVAALRQQGATVQTFSVRSPQSTQALSMTQKEECDRTSYLLPLHQSKLPPKLLLELLAAHLWQLIRQPVRYFQALALAWKTRQLGIRGTLYQLIYFIEAGLLAHRLHRQNIAHLHNHFGDSSGTVAMLASALSGIGYSFTLHGPGIFFEPHRWRLDEKIRRAKFVSCISHFCQSQAMIFAPVESWSNLHIIHCGIDPQQFEGSEFTRSAETHSAETHNRHRLLYIGRLAAAKGLPILLQSLVSLKRTCPGVHLTVVGDGSDRDRLMAQVAALDLSEQVEFVGYQSPAAVRQYLQAADVFVMSSFAEGVPVVLMEAMIAGLPVVATQVGGVSELVEEGVNGFVVPPSDGVALSDRIQCLLADANLRQQFGQQGQQKVAKSFNIHHEARKLYRLMAIASGDRSLSDAPTELAVTDAVSASMLI